jgi:tripeptide aminopeptidase
MTQDLISYFLELVQIDSESRNERGVADKLKRDLIELGFRVEEDDAGEKTGGNAGNIYAYLPGKKESDPLLFCAHIDTVRPGNGIRPEIQEGRIVSAGETILGADDKSGVAEIIFGIKEVISSGEAYPPLEVLFTVCEEIGLLGARYFDKSRLKSKLGYAFDSEAIGEFMTGAPSQNTIKIKVFGKEAHAGVEPEKGINAIRVAAEAIAAIPMGRIDFETTANVGVINGGMATNIVPNLVELKGEARSHNPQKLEQVTNDIISAFQKAAARHKLENVEARVEIEVKTEYRSFFMEESKPVVQIARKALDKLNVTPNFGKGGGGSDANIINAEGVEMIVAGTGMHGYHTVDENILVADLKAGAAIVSELIRTYLQM